RGRRTRRSRGRPPCTSAPLAAHSRSTTDRPRRDDGSGATSCADEQPDVRHGEGNEVGDDDLQPDERCRIALQDYVELVDAEQKRADDQRRRRSPPQMLRQEHDAPRLATRAPRCGVHHAVYLRYGAWASSASITYFSLSGL